MKKALVIVDVQNDFLEGGNLAVPQGDEIIELINNLQDRYELVLATQDWHPINHKSFTSQYLDKKDFDEILLNGLNQTLWPDHCVQDTYGACLSAKLSQNNISAVFRKGTNREIDSYSAFFDNGHLRSTGLHGYLQDHKITEIHICGLAADFCVYYTAMDALKLGYKVFIVSKATRCIDKDTYMTKKIEFIKSGGSFI